MLIGHTLNYLKLKKKIWGYDTFAGVPKINIKKDRYLGKGKRKQINEEEMKTSNEWQDKQEATLGTSHTRDNCTHTS